MPGTGKNKKAHLHSHGIDVQAPNKEGMMVVGQGYSQKQKTDNDKKSAAEKE